MSRLNRILLVIVIILALATAVLWFFPDVLSVVSALNPFAGEEIAPAIISTPSTPAPVNQSQPTPAEAPVSVATVIDDDAEPEEKEEELTPFEKEIRQRHESYQTKIYTYDPYQPPVIRNPFQRMVSSVYLADEEEKIAGELSTEEDIRRFVQPELPPGSKFTGLISSGEDRLAILEMDGETFIVKEGDLILDKFYIKSIWEEKLIIDVNGFEISLQLGGGEATNG